SVIILSIVGAPCSARILFMASSCAAGRRGRRLAASSSKATGSPANRVGRSSDFTKLICLGVSRAADGFLPDFVEPPGFDAASLGAALVGRAWDIRPAAGFDLGFG